MYEYSCIHVLIFFLFYMISCVVLIFFCFDYSCMSFFRYYHCQLKEFIVLKKLFQVWTSEEPALTCTTPQPTTTLLWIRWPNPRRRECTHRRRHLKVSVRHARVHPNNLEFTSLSDQMWNQDFIPLIRCRVFQSVESLPLSQWENHWAAKPFGKKGGFSSQK